MEDAPGFFILEPRGAPITKNGDAHIGGVEALAGMEVPPVEDETPERRCIGAFVEAMEEPIGHALAAAARAVAQPGARIAPAPVAGLVADGQAARGDAA